MSRKVFDILTGTGGAVVVVVLLIAGGLLTWGQSFVNSNVHDQLAQQQIYFPPKSAFAHTKPRAEITPSMIPSVSQYAGQQLLTGLQAKAYADDFSAVHHGGVYSKISAAALAKPKNTKLQALKQTSFLGATLRGLLLEAYAFSKIGQGCSGAIASFVLAAIMLVLVVLGFRHARRTLRESPLLKTNLIPASETRSGRAVAPTPPSGTWVVTSRFPRPAMGSSPHQGCSFVGMAPRRCGSSLTA